MTRAMGASGMDIEEREGREGPGSSGCDGLVCAGTVLSADFEVFDVCARHRVFWLTRGTEPRPSVSCFSDRDGLDASFGTVMWNSGKAPRNSPRAVEDTVRRIPVGGRKWSGSAGG
jgi:hypothetical protein